MVSGGQWTTAVVIIFVRKEINWCPGFLYQTSVDWVTCNCAISGYTAVQTAGVVGSVEWQSHMGALSAALMTCHCHLSCPWWHRRPSGHVSVGWAVSSGRLCCICLFSAVWHDESIIIWCSIVLMLSGTHWGLKYLWRSLLQQAQANSLSLPLALCQQSMGVDLLKIGGVEERSDISEQFVQLIW